MFQLAKWWWQTVVTGTPNTVVPLMDTLLAAFVGALATASTRLATFSIGLLSVLFLIGYVREFGPRVATGVGSLSDALGAPLLYFVMVGGYMWVLLNLTPMATALMETAIAWGIEGSAGQFSRAYLTTPSLIMQAGLDAVAPIVAFDTFWKSVSSMYQLATDPWLLIAAIAILLAFGSICLHFIAMVIEFNLAVAMTYVLLPWGIWSTSSFVAEFALGWVVGSAIRALVTCAMLGIGVPLFALLAQPASTMPLIPDNLVLACGALLFAVLCWQLPAKVAYATGRASLAFTGHSIAAAAMTTARFGQMTAGVVRGTSQLLQRAS